MKKSLFIFNILIASGFYCLQLNASATQEPSATEELGAIQWEEEQPKETKEEKKRAEERRSKIPESLVPQFQVINNFAQKALEEFKKLDPNQDAKVMKEHFNEMVNNLKSMNELFDKAKISEYIGSKYGYIGVFAIKPIQELMATLLIGVDQFLAHISQRKVNDPTLGGTYEEMAGLWDTMFDIEAFPDFYLSGWFENHQHNPKSTIYQRFTKEHGEAWLREEAKRNSEEY